MANELIIKKPAINLKEAKAREAWIVNDDEPGTGFKEDADEGVACISGKAGTPEIQLPYDHPSVIDAQKRAEDAGVSQEINEHTQMFLEENIGSVRKFRFNHQQDFMEWVPGRILNLGGFLALLQSIRPDAFVVER